jgi:hypothetical protein
MSKLARALIAGTSAATLISAASFAEPTDRVEIDQSNAGDTRASEDVTAADAETVVTNAFAQANSATGLITNWTGVTGSQSLSGSSVGASAIAMDNAWSYVTSGAQAQGNALSVRGDANADIAMSQSAESTARVRALSDLRISSYAGHTVQTAAATTNAAGVSGYGARDVTLTQSAAGETSAVARLDASDAEIETVAQGVQAAGNSLTMAGGDFARGEIDQSQSGTVQAIAEGEVGLADYGVVSTSQAAGNTVTLTNDYGYGEVRGGQSNSGSVRAVTRLDLGDYANGVAAGSANAVGNSALTSVIGADGYSGIAQTNTGSVSALVDFNGGAGGGLGTALNATAMGNAQSAYICSECPVSLGGQFTQTNAGSVTSRVNGVHTGYTGAITSTSTAIGNAATFATRQGG